MNSRNQRMLDNEIARAEQHAREDAASITRWYQLRRNQAMMELGRLENAYNQRMADHTVEWAQRLSDLYLERERLNVREAWHMSQEEMDEIEKEMLDESNFPPIPRLERQTNVMYLDQDQRADFDYMDLPVAPMPVAPMPVAPMPVAPMDLADDDEPDNMAIHIVSDDEEDEDAVANADANAMEMC